ncbi:MAG: hypothetical protein DRJ42_09395, partial [Deltaproteobacteria bacterium]
LTALAAVALLGGCPGSLEDPGRFEAGVPACDAEELLIRSCGSEVCHDADAPQADLDLVSPGVASRLVDVPAVLCVDLGNLVDSADPQGASAMLQKLQTDPGCGLQMPPSPFEPLTSDEVSCLSAWVDEITGGGSMDAGAFDAAMDAPMDAPADGSGGDAAEGGT